MEGREACNSKKNSKGTNGRRKKANGSKKDTPPGSRTLRSGMRIRNVNRYTRGVLHLFCLLRTVRRMLDEVWHIENYEEKTGK